MSDRYQRWYVVDYHNSYSRTKMEDQLMNWARNKWLNCSVYETSLEDMVKALKVKQGRFLEQNRRLKPVPISLGRFTQYSPDDIIRHLYIGGCYLSLRKIREELEYVEFVSV